MGVLNLKKKTINHFFSLTILRGNAVYKTYVKIVQYP